MNNETQTPQLPPERSSYADRRRQRIDALATASAEDEGGVSLILSAWRRLRRNPVFLVGLAITVAFLVLALVAPWLAPWSMPMSFMVSVGRSRRGGTSARIPARGASVATPIPDRSAVSATKE